MKKNRLVLLPLLIVLLAFTMACALLEQLLPTQAPAPTEAFPASTEAPPQPTLEPTAIEEPTPTTPPTEVLPNHGQILFVADGNIWRYLVDSGDIAQLTFDGVADSHDNQYGNPLFSADGHYASYIKNGVSYLHNLADNSVISLPVRIVQWSHTQPASFYAANGTFECPAVDNLEEQDEINFDLLRYEVDNLGAPTLLANIGGGLKFVHAISNDEQYASILYCACYSECFSYVIHHLPSNTPMPAPPDLYPGDIDFSPESSRLATSQWQIYGYIESSLYLANSDFSGSVTLFSAPNVAVFSPFWSPNGDWIAFTAYDIADEFELSNTRVLLINLDGSVVLEIANSYAELTSWSPDGSQVLFRRGEWGSYTPFIYDILSGATIELPFTTASGNVDWGVLP